MGQNSTSPSYLCRLHSRGGPNHYFSHPECSSFDPVSAELDAIAATEPVLLLIAQVRLVENDGEFSNKWHFPGRDLRT